jgi:hypothetical protein
MDPKEVKHVSDEFERALGGLMGWMNKFRLTVAKPPNEAMRVDKEGRCHVTLDFEVGGLEYSVPLMLERKTSPGDGGGFTLDVDHGKRSFELMPDGSPKGATPEDLERAAEDIADALVETASGPSE